MVPKVGQLLYRGCACDDFARVLRVGQDDNGVDVIDVELIESVNELYFPEGFDEDGVGCLTRIELPDGTPVRICDVQWKPRGDGSIECRMTTGGCNRCTSVFYPHDEGKDPFAEVEP
jgi:hypothetical protein